jgi:5'-3' exonuclease
VDDLPEDTDMEDAEMDDAEMDEQVYDSLEAAVKDIVGDNKLATSAAGIDKVLDGDDTDALDKAMTTFLDMIEDMMGGDKDDDLKIIAEVLADMIEQMNAPDGGMPDEDDVEKKMEDEDEEEDEYTQEMKRMYSDETREEMAKSGMALPDGSYPIKDRGDLQNAIQAFGRAKDKEKAKKHIMKRARDLDAEDMLPESWTSGKTDYVNISDMKALLDSLDK